MKFTTRDDSRQGQPADASHFTGPASSLPLHRTEQPNPVNVNLVRFEPGVRNHWHRHAGGQLLHVVDPLDKRPLNILAPRGVATASLRP